MTESKPPSWALSRIEDLLPSLQEDVKGINKKFERLWYENHLLKAQLTRWKDELVKLAEAGPEFTFDELILIIRDRIEDLECQLDAQDAVQKTESAYAEMCIAQESGLD